MTTESVDVQGTLEASLEHASDARLALRDVWESDLDATERMASALSAVADALLAIHLELHAMNERAESMR